MPKVALTDPLALEQIVARQGEETIQIAARRDDDCANNDGCCVVHSHFCLRTNSGSFAMFAAILRASWLAQEGRIESRIAWRGNYTPGACETSKNVALTCEYA